MEKNVFEEYYIMERIIIFPKAEYQSYREGIKNYKTQEYKKAINFFEKAVNVKYLKKECIKYLIDCHIELHHFDEVYKMIENEFIDKNIDEEYLLKKYLHTMVIEEQYLEVLELINIYQHTHSISTDLRLYLNQLQKALEDQKSPGLMKYFLSNDFSDHIQIILNLDKLDIDKYHLEMERFFNNPNVDAFVKYSLLKYVMENNIFKEISYTNYFADSFTISKTNYFDLNKSNLFLIPISKVSNNLKFESNLEALITNIWYDFCIKYFPNLIENIDLASAVLHVFMLKSLKKQFNISDICKTYKITTDQLFYYFKM